MLQKGYVTRVTRVEGAEGQAVSERDFAAFSLRYVPI